jgi:hypothetical protein
MRFTFDTQEGWLTAELPNVLSQLSLDDSDVFEYTNPMASRGQLSSSPRPTPTIPIPKLIPGEATIPMPKLVPVRVGAGVIAGVG